MKRLLVALLVAAGLAAGAGTAHADTWVVVPETAPLLPAAAANAVGVLFPPDLSAAPAAVQQLSTQELVPIWQAAGSAYGVPWQVLAAINKVESNFGTNMGPSSAGAVGWMQFMPATWLEYGTDANGDGVADPWNAQDAIYSAARYLAASGGQTDVRGAVFAYNHAAWYVDEVLQLASSYEAGVQVDSISAATDGSISQAQQDVDAAQAALDDGLGEVHSLVAARRLLDVDTSQDQLLAERLDAAGQAAQADAAISDARARIRGLRTAVSAAEQALARAREGVAAAAFAPTYESSLAAPLQQGDWVFPVGGGPGIVSVSPAPVADGAAEIAAPAGTPVYALAAAQVVSASPDPSGDCGIAVTLQTSDGRNWTYCHLAYLEASVSAGASLAAGQRVGLVGQTGTASAPALSLRADSGSTAPQQEPWLAGFVGRAFSWGSGSPAAPAFAVVSP
jgi:murein DD-endopeptidase MepM/ murein hydrolase activator NlpD